MSQNTLKPRLAPILLAIMFIGPLLAAYWLYKSDYHPENTTNYGDFVSPMLRLQDVSELPGATEEKRLGKWVLMVNVTPTCDQSCEEALYLTRQIRKALGKYSSRVERFLVAAKSDQPNQGLKELLKDSHPELKRQWWVNPDKMPDVFAEYQMFIIDPMGNFVFGYPAGAEPKGVIKDFKRLLKNSKIG